MSCIYIFVFLYSQLGNLERKWQHHEQNNFVMRDCILYTLHFITSPGPAFTKLFGIRIKIRLKLKILLL